MTSKWFFQNHFATASLVQIQAVACDFNYSNIGNTWSSTNLSLYFLNTAYYIDSDWGKTVNPGAYKPFPTISTTQYYWYKDRGQPKTFQPSTKDYLESVNYDTGFFCWKLLNAYSINNDPTKPDAPQSQAHKPVGVARYNPQVDTGVGNEVWVVSSLTMHYDKPRNDNSLIFAGYPLWMIFHGYYNYILKVKKDETFLNSHFFVLRSPAIVKLSGTTEQDYYPIIDQSFLNGKMPYDEYLDAKL